MSIAPTEIALSAIAAVTGSLSTLIAYGAANREAKQERLLAAQQRLKESESAALKSYAAERDFAHLRRAHESHAQAIDILKKEQEESLRLIRQLCLKLAPELLEKNL